MYLPWVPPIISPVAPIFSEDEKIDLLVFRLLRESREKRRGVKGKIKIKNIGVGRVRQDNASNNATLKKSLQENVFEKEVRYMHPADMNKR